MISRLYQVLQVILCLDLERVWRKRRGYECAKIKFVYALHTGARMEVSFSHGPVTIHMETNPASDHKQA